MSQLTPQELELVDHIKGCTNPRQLLDYIVRRLKEPSQPISDRAASEVLAVLAGEDVFPTRWHTVKVTKAVTPGDRVRHVPTGRIGRIRRVCREEIRECVMTGEEFLPHEFVRLDDLEFVGEPVPVPPHPDTVRLDWVGRTGASVYLFGDGWVASHSGWSSDEFPDFRLAIDQGVADDANPIDRE